MKQSTFSAVMANSIKNLLQGYTKGIRFLLVMFLTLTVSANAWAETYSHSFNSTGTISISNNSVTLSNVTWNVVTTTGKGNPTYNSITKGYNYCGWQFGSSKNVYYSKVILSTDAFSSYNVQSVTLNMRLNGGVNTTMTVKQGSTTIGSATMSTANVWTDLVANSTKGTGGDLSITIATTQAFFIHSITVTYEEAVSCTDPTITTQPTGATYTTGATATALKVVASGDDLTYQWYSNTSNSTSGATKINGATNSTYTPSTSTVGTKYYYCIVSSGSCSTTSSIVSIVVTPTYTVTYHANGATSGTVPEDDTKYTSGTTVTVMSNSGNLAKTGHTFGGWNTNSSGTGTNYTAGSGTFNITGNTTLYAKWTAKQSTITIDPNTTNHGTGSNVSVTATYGQTLPSFTACTPATGYELVGYYTSATGGTKVIAKDGKLVASVSGYTDANAKWINESVSLTLYAQYSAINYTVTYAANSGTTTCTGGTYTYNSSFTICSDEPTRTGYTFTGWSDGTNIYQPGDNYTMPAKNVTFTAQWRINTYTVTWKVDGVTKRTDTGVAYNTSKTAPTISPVPCGDVIAGWTDAVDGNYEHGTSTLHSGATPSITITSDKTFYAVFADYKKD